MLHDSHFLGMSAVLLRESHTQDRYAAAMLAYAHPGTGSSVGVVAGREQRSGRVVALSCLGAWGKHKREWVPATDPMAADYLSEWCLVGLLCIS
jgi:hypothetical protein